MLSAIKSCFTCCFHNYSNKKDGGLQEYFLTENKEINFKQHKEMASNILTFICNQNSEQLNKINFIYLVLCILVINDRLNQQSDIFNKKADLKEQIKDALTLLITPVSSSNTQRHNNTSKKTAMSDTPSTPTDYTLIFHNRYYSQQNEDNFDNKHTDKYYCNSSEQQLIEISNNLMTITENVQILQYCNNKLTFLPYNQSSPIFKNICSMLDLENSVKNDWPNIQDKILT